MAKKKKTRQEKIIADLRRRLETTKELQWEVKIEKPANETRTEKIEIQESSLPRQQLDPSSPAIVSMIYLKKDLTKTLILAILALGFELVVYFVAG